MFIYILIIYLFHFNNKVDTMDISAGVLVREGNIIRRGPRQVDKSIVLSILHEIIIILDIKKNPYIFTCNEP